MFKYFLTSSFFSVAMYHHVAVTDSQGLATVDNLERTGIWTVNVDAQGYEPVSQEIEVKPDPSKNFVTVKMAPLSKGSIKLQSDKLRAKIWASRSQFDIDMILKESERLVKATSPQLKKLATKKFEEICKAAEKKRDDLRKFESSFALGVGPDHVEVSRKVKKTAVSDPKN
jgi:hypothetical protein